jgi:hypothetical protein
LEDFKNGESARFRTGQPTGEFCSRRFSEIKGAIKCFVYAFIKKS